MGQWHTEVSRFTNVYKRLESLGTDGEMTVSMLAQPFKQDSGGSSGDHCAYCVHMYMCMLCSINVQGRIHFTTVSSGEGDKKPG